MDTIAIKDEALWVPLIYPKTAFLVSERAQGFSITAAPDGLDALLRSLLDPGGNEGERRPRVLRAAGHPPVVRGREPRAPRGGRPPGRLWRRRGGGGTRPACDRGAAGCDDSRGGASGDDRARRNDGGAGGGRPGACGTLLISSQADPERLGTNYWGFLGVSLGNVLFDRLVELNEDGTSIVPGLATELPQSPDGKVWTFTLRTV